MLPVYMILHSAGQGSSSDMLPLVSDAVHCIRSLTHTLRLTSPDYVYPTHIQGANACAEGSPTSLLYASMIPDRNHPVRESEILLHAVGTEGHGASGGVSSDLPSKYRGVLFRTPALMGFTIEEGMEAVLGWGDGAGEESKKAVSKDPLASLASALLNALCFHRTHYGSSEAPGTPGVLLLFTDYDPSVVNSNTPDTELVSFTTECALASAVSLAALDNIAVTVYGPHVHRSSRLRGLCASTGGFLKTAYAYTDLGLLLEDFKERRSQSMHGTNEEGNWVRQQREWVGHHYTFAPSLLPPDGQLASAGAIQPSSLGWLCAGCMTVTYRSVSEGDGRASSQLISNTTKEQLCPYCGG